jgi:CheY-like chemotaxis protein
MAAEALEYIRSVKYENGKTVILVDIQMPVMDGFEFLDAFEEQLDGDDAERFVVNLLTSSINEKDREKASEYKFVNKFLSKPLTNAALSGVLE